MYKSGVLLFSFCILAGCGPSGTDVVSHEIEKGTEAKKEEKRYTIAKSHFKVWKEAIAQTLELGEAMPEDQYAFKPHDSIRTFAEQLVHIAASSKTLANLYLKDIPRPENRTEHDANTLSKEEVLALVKTNLEEVGEMIKQMDDEQLMGEEVQSFAGNPMLRLHGMMFIYDHLTNHRAKANLYMRVSGNEPPKYRYN